MLINDNPQDIYQSKEFTTGNKTIPHSVEKPDMMDVSALIVKMIQPKKKPVRFKVRSNQFDPALRHQSMLVQRNGDSFARET